MANVSRKNSENYGDSKNTLYSVGIGTSQTNKVNAIEIMQNGNMYLYNVGNYKGTDINNSSTLQDIIISLSDKKVNADDIISDDFINNLN
jgi:hypothetical protein